MLNVVGLPLLLAIWQMIFSLRLCNPTLLPSPGASLGRLWDILITRNVWPDLEATLLRMAIGFGLAATLGVAAGLMMGAYRPLHRVLMPIVDFARSTPVTACYPVFVLLAGVNHASKSLMVFAASLPIIMLNTSYGVRNVSPIRAQMARLFGASTLQIFLNVTVWEAAPQIWIGLRTAFSLALVVEIVAEMFAGTRFGIGQRIFEAFNTYQTEELYALILLTGGLGYLMNLVFGLSESRLLHWSSK